MDRVCKRCGGTKPIDDFPMVRTKYTLADGEVRRWEGKRKICKHCKYLMDREVRDAEKSIEYQKQYRLEHREKGVAYAKAYYEKNAPELREAKKEYARRNKSASQARGKRWRLENREKLRISYANKKARRKAAPGNFTLIDIANLYEDQRGLCVYCQTSLDGGYHIDHFIALSNGGSNYPENLQLACAQCNLLKRARDPHEFVQSEFGRLF